MHRHPHHHLRSRARGLIGPVRFSCARHDPEKWEPVFGKRSCSNKEVERDDDSKKNHPALDRQHREELLTCILRIGGAQLGAIQKTDSRQVVVRRMLDLLDRAKAQNCDLVVYPELALTTFFPRWYMTDQADVDSWFEREMPNAATRPLFEEAARYGIGLTFGYAELTSDGHHFNTSALVDRDGRIIGKYRKVHLPGHLEYDPQRAFQHLEK